MIRRLLRFLARREIEAARRWAEIDRVVALTRAAQHGFLAGHHAGVEEAFSVVEAEVRARMGGAVDLPTEEDLKRARKGLVH